MKTSKPVVKNKKIAAAKPKAIKSRPVVKKEAKKEEMVLRVLGLENLHVPFGAHKKRKLLGRGSGSGHGKTSTRGSKGQTSRTGRDFYTGFEGGQTPMIRRFPKRGFFSVNKKVYQIVNLESLAKLKATDITPEILEEKGLIKNKEKLIKILGEGQLASAVNVKAHAFSKKAVELISKAGGKAEIIKPA